MKTGNPFQVIDLFNEALTLPTSKKESLLSVADDFFNEFEDGLYLQIVGSRDETMLVHFLVVPSGDKSRELMEQGFIYGYFAEKNSK